MRDIAYYIWKHNSAKKIVMVTRKCKCFTNIKAYYIISTAFLSSFLKNSFTHLSQTHSDGLSYSSLGYKRLSNSEKCDIKTRILIVCLDSHRWHIPMSPAGEVTREFLLQTTSGSFGMEIQTHTKMCEKLKQK